MALSAAATAATVSLGLIVQSTTDAAARIRQFAQVANATPEALQRRSAGARTVGIEQEKLADILKDVNDRVGDFLQTGGGPMADFFENVAPRVGVTADQFARLSGPEALQLYVDTLERAVLSQQEMTFYLEAMAFDATRLLPLLRNGGAEMARLGDQASDLARCWMAMRWRRCAARSWPWALSRSSSRGCATASPWRWPRPSKRWPMPSWRWPRMAGSCGPPSML
jgi:hypothetical protein